MKAPSPAFRFYPKDVLSDERCTVMSHAEFGMYVRLLCYAWLEGSIPADHVRLQRILRVTAKTFAAAWPAIFPCWEIQDLRLFQPRLEIERGKQRAYHATQSEKAIKRRKSIVINKTKKPRHSRSTAVAVPSVSVSVSSNNGKAPTEPATLDGSLGPETPMNVPEEVTAIAVSTPAKSGDRLPAKSRLSWLTPYGDSWRERWGEESEPPWGELGTALKRPYAEMDHDDLEARWKRFLAASERSEWARPARFIQGLGQWSDEGCRTAITTRVHMTAADRTTDAVRQIRREQEQKRRSGN